MLMISQSMIPKGISTLTIELDILSLMHARITFNIFHREGGCSHTAVMS